MNRRARALVLFSGGLDSTLAIRIIQDQGIYIEAINFSTPFCQCDKCVIASSCEKLGIKIHRVFLGQEYLNLITNPPHGYGSQMNPCIDCRILMFRHAKKMSEEIGAEFIVTGEVLDERPFSQRRNAMFMIEKEAGLEGKVLRPLSAKLLPETDVEKKGLVDRKKLFEIKGRRRVPQIQLAEKLEITDYPCPSGGCLLTDPRFSDRLRDFLKYSPKLTLIDIALLKLGRHFRVEGSKIIVGRNEEENRNLLSIARKEGIPYFEVAEYMGPITLLIGKEDEELTNKAASITIRYSDAPKEVDVNVKYVTKTTKIIATCAAEDSIVKWRV